MILKSKVSVFVELFQRREQAKREAAARARLEAERAAAERASRQKDQFLAALSHELRTPLTSILLWSDMLLKKPLPPETSRRGVETIDLCARHEARLVDNVLEMSRLVTGTALLDPTAVDFGEIVAESVIEVAGLAGERGVRIACAAEAGRWSGVADRERLRHVLYNLLENAVKFTPQGGHADVTIEGGDAELLIRISDTGLGFEADTGSRLFERFAQGDPGSTRVRGGLGLGLALAKAMVELHGGALTAASDGIGRGATFTIALPARGRADRHNRPAMTPPSAVSNVGSMFWPWTTSPANRRRWRRCWPGPTSRSCGPLRERRRWRWCGRASSRS